MYVTTPRQESTTTVRFGQTRIAGTDLGTVWCSSEPNESAEEFEQSNTIDCLLLPSSTLVVDTPPPGLTTVDAKICQMRLASWMPRRAS